MASPVAIGPGPAVIQTEIDACVALFRSDTGEVLILNQTASDVWRLCDGEHSPERVAAVLSRAYQMDPRSIRKDVDDAIASLRDRGFLVSSPTAR